MKPIKALSIRQPWAWAITTPAIGKDIENRSWRTKHRGPLLVHAGKGLKASDLEAFEATIAASAELQARVEAAGGVPLDELRARPAGIVGAVEVVGCVQASASPWFFGPFGFVLTGGKPLPFRPCKGALNLFDPALDEPGDLRAAAGIPDRFQTLDLFVGLNDSRKATP